ncbi:hypothetical protein [Sphingomonas sp. KR3-1]|uniref:hypothetical protein n=1 Tax=Sphingomonas sp. KR3-1 TaxID=3156611 RepID=UPI0032B452B5
MRILGMSAAVLALAGCSIGKAVPAAEDAATSFHHMLNAGRFADTYAQAAPDLRAATPQDKWLKRLGAVHARLGREQWAKTAGWNDNFTNGRHFVVLDQDVQYEHGLAREKLTFRIDGEKPSLAGYRVSADGQALN